MEQDEKDFWVALGLWAVAFITAGRGLSGLLFEDRYIYGSALTLIGLGGMGYVRLHLKGRRLTRMHAVIGALSSLGYCSATTF
jgi:hypothetical protein